MIGVGPGRPVHRGCHLRRSISAFKPSCPRGEHARVRITPWWMTGAPGLVAQASADLRPTGRAVGSRQGHGGVERRTSSGGALNQFAFI